MADPTIPATRRLVHVDALRGLIMLTMALDHTRAFVVREHPFEIWSDPLPAYAAALPFVTRLVTHFCAPGFFFLMGIGMTLLALSRRRSGWSEGRIGRYFLIRGLLLLVVQQVIENPAWILGTMGAAPEPASEGVFKPPSGDTPAIFLGVLYALGLSMVFWGFLLRLSSWLVLLVSIGAIAVTQAVMLAVMGRATDFHALSFSPLARLFLVPGKSGALFVIYPLIPWLGLTGLGIVFGRYLSDGKRGASQAFAWGATFLAIFVAVRLFGGVGNIHVPVPDGWIGFLNVTKYPPSLAFITMTLGVDLTVLGIFAIACNGNELWAVPLLSFGRCALFFYIVHLYIFALIGFAFPHGAPITMAYPVWAVGLTILFPLCRAYERFKHGRPAESLWRLF